ncbi:MAG: hypothetical protein AAGH78_17415, partial [Cyanobacteria bacterium P01_H01_bin.58]
VSKISSPPRCKITVPAALLSWFIALEPPPLNPRQAAHWLTRRLLYLPMLNFSQACDRLSQSIRIWSQVKW